MRPDPPPAPRPPRPPSLASPTSTRSSQAGRPVLPAPPRPLSGCAGRGTRAGRPGWRPRRPRPDVGAAARSWRAVQGGRLAGTHPPHAAIGRRGGEAALQSLSRPACRMAPIGRSPGGGEMWRTTRACGAARSRPSLSRQRRCPRPPPAMRPFLLKGHSRPLTQIKYERGRWRWQTPPASARRPPSSPLHLPLCRFNREGDLLFSCAKVGGGRGRARTARSAGGRRPAPAAADRGPRRDECHARDAAAGRAGRGRRRPRAATGGGGRRLPPSFLV